ncbi:MAG: helix-turn-helix domain-containing protein [Pseudomonadota bacterium]
MDAKTLEIVKAGWAMFARYGYAKTTMSDIASEAGVARQTVYNAFSSKEDILRAVMRHAGEVSLNDVTTAWESASSADEKVSMFQKLAPEAWYQAITAAPDWGALMDGINTAAAGELSHWEEQWVTAITQMLRDTLDADRDDLEEIARFLYSASKNAKYGVSDVDELRQRLATIHKATMALLST